MNINLNVGGIIGAIVFGVIAFPIAFAVSTPEKDYYWLVIACVIAGAFLGNATFAKCFTRKSD